MMGDPTGAMSSPEVALAAAIRRYEERMAKDPASLGFALRTRRLGRAPQIAWRTAETIASGPKPSSRMPRT